MKKAIYVCILVCVLGLASGVNAQSTMPDASYDNYTGSLVICGEAEAGSFLSLEIIKPGYTYEDMKGVSREAAMYHCDQTTADKNGYQFAITFRGASGNYRAVVVDYNTKERSEFELTLINPTGYADAVAALNAAAGISENRFKTTLNENLFNLGFSFDITASAESVTGFYNFVKTTPLSVEEPEKNASLYKSYVLMSALEDGLVPDALNYISDIYYETPGLEEDLSALAEMNTGAGMDFTNRLKGKTMTTLTQFNNELKIACILATTKYANGYQPIVDVLTDYGSLVGITGAISSRVCQQMNKNDYTADNIDDAYLTFLSQNQGGGSTGGGGGGGGVAGSPNNRTELDDFGPSTTIGSGTTEDKVESSETMIFTDLGEKHWAAKSVLWLKEQGIVSGTDTGVFEPDRAVTREEFTKMLVLACGLESNEKTVTFVDAEPGAWYIPYLGTALDAGIVLGMGEGVFGIGQNISRQDMAVMVDRALMTMRKELAVIRDYQDFADESAIAVYAKNAVSALYQAGIINGKGENLFDPNGYATRAEAAKIIYEAFKEV